MSLWNSTDLKSHFEGVLWQNNLWWLELDGKCFFLSFFLSIVYIYNLGLHTRLTLLLLLGSLTLILKKKNSWSEFSQIVAD